MRIWSVILGFLFAPLAFQQPTLPCRSLRAVNGQPILDCPGLNREQTTEVLRAANNIIATESRAVTQKLAELLRSVNSGQIFSAPRRLTVDQKRALLISARDHAGQRIRVSYLRGDNEAQTLAGDIVDVLRRAGWAGLEGEGVTETSGDQQGVFVGVSSGEVQSTRAGQYLLESLHEFGLVANGGNIDTTGAEVRIVIGRQPVPEAPRTIAILTPHAGAVQSDPFVCPRPAPGDPVMQPAEIRSVNGSLHVALSLYSGLDTRGLKVFCFLTANGTQAPTLRVRPGDELVLTLKNSLSLSFEQSHVHIMAHEGLCTGGEMTPSSTNLHFHGWSVPPVCHQDETLSTVVQPSGPPFEYRIRIPKDQPPGLYWYHPHPHGFSEAQVLGGASGALIVEGIEQRRADAAGLPERILTLRDQRVPGFEEIEEDAGPGKNVSINYVPIEHPLYTPARLVVPPNQRELWRVLNASADTYFQLQVVSMRVAQLLKLVAVDGIPVAESTPDTVLLVPGGRAEFIVSTPGPGIAAQLVTRAYDTGPDGVANPSHVLAEVRSSANAPFPARLPVARTASNVASGLANLTPAAQRRIYFSEAVSGQKVPQFFVTVDGETPKVFSMDFKAPNITVQQGTVEDWIVENRAREAHAFHIHQVHFQVLERDGKAVSNSGLRDTIDLPYWGGTPDKYPSVKLRMDFRSKEIVGTFVYHCHILEHEDGGMMGVIQVIPATR